MEFQTLKKDNKKKYIIGSTVLIGILATITYIGTRAKYKLTSSVQLATGTIHYSPSDLEILAVKVQNETGEYENVDAIPTSGYTLNTEKSICKVGEEKQEVRYIIQNNAFYIEVNKKGTKCELYFDESKTGKNLILANNTIDNSRNSGYFSEIFEEDTSGRIFSAEDDNGTTYFFAGSNPNNWVKFGKYADNIPDVYRGYYSATSSDYREYPSLEACKAGTDILSSYNVNCTKVENSSGKDIYWRIIRINGDGSIRLIYNGTTTDQTGETTQIGKSAFNTSDNDNAYLGYMYGRVDNWIDGGQSSTISTLYLDPSKSYYYGTSYTSTPENGISTYTINGNKINGTWTKANSGNYIGKYTCLRTTSDFLLSCSTLYKIVSYQDETHANVYTYNRIGAGSTTYVKTHTNTNSSTIKTYLDTWYEENLKTNYEKYIDTNAGFCGDRTVDNFTSGYTGDGSGKTPTQYAAFKRAFNTYTATYKCSNSNDYYTVSTSNKGNKALENPIGLITSDEVMYAGGYKSGTQNHWLNTGQSYWNMSPNTFLGSYAFVVIVYSAGNVNSTYVSSASGVRPVINLKADALTVGSGTITDPYVIIK